MSNAQSSRDTHIFHIIHIKFSLLLYVCLLGFLGDGTLLDNVPWCTFRFESNITHAWRKSSTREWLQHPREKRGSEEETARTKARSMKTVLGGEQSSWKYLGWSDPIATLLDPWDIAHNLRHVHPPSTLSRMSDLTATPVDLVEHAPDMTRMFQPPGPSDPNWTIWPTYTHMYGPNSSIFSFLTSSFVDGSIYSPS